MEDETLCPYSREFCSEVKCPNYYGDGAGTQVDPHFKCECMCHIDCNQNCVDDI